MDDNLSRQIEEVETLKSIYEDSWVVEDEAHRSYSINIKEGSFEVTLFVNLPEEYPSEAPPIYELSAPWLKGSERKVICGHLEEIYLKNLGESILFLWIDKLRTILQNKGGPHGEDDPKLLPPEKLFQAEIELIGKDEIFETPPITHGETITDRKSVFQGHSATIVTVEQVRAVLAKLYENKRISNATHNMYAYRIYKEDKNSFIQDCEDDGESHAGGRLLHLLEIVDARNVIVVVTRWYGGIHLGPDRFRHINNAARQVLELSGHIKSSQTPSTSEKHSKKKK